MNKLPALLLISAASLFITSCAGKSGPEKLPPLTDKMKATLYQRALTQFDYNRDGILSCDDVYFKRKQTLLALDKNKDNRLSPIEYRGAQFEDKDFMFHEFAILDKNGDGFLSLKEISIVPDNNFRSMDKNGDCTMNRDEVAESMQRQMVNIGRSVEEGPGGSRHKQPPKREPNEGGVDPF